MKRLEVAIDRLNDIVGKVVSYSILIMMFLVVYEVLTRRLLNSPTVWTFETITMVFGFHFMMVIPYTLLHKGIVAVDIFYSYLGEKKQCLLDLLTYIFFFFPYVIGMLIYSVPFAYSSWVIRETSWSVFAPPVYPVKTVIPVVFFLLLLQGISEMSKIIRKLRGVQA